MPMGVAWKESTPEGFRPPQYSEGGGAPVRGTGALSESVAVFREGGRS